jgi:CspA family cold shock protein
MSSGIVKFFNQTKGFGFIKDDETGEDVFVHLSGLNGTSIRENDKVSFDTQDTQRGKSAINVVKL